MKTNIFLTGFIVIALLAITIVLPVNAGNSTENLTASPFITIDPIGNHSLDEVFFIHGTTNLLPSTEPLLFQITTTRFNPAGTGSSFRASPMIQPGENGINRWSCNATTDRWRTFLSPGPRPQEPLRNALPGEYIVTVASTDPRVPSDSWQKFFINPPMNTENGTTIPFWISIEAPGDHGTGNNFTIDGTTNLPLNTDIRIEVVSISSGQVNPDGPASESTQQVHEIGSTTIISDTEGNHVWSFEINTTSLNPGEYLIKVYSPAYGGGTHTSTTAIFRIIPEGTRITTGVTDNVIALQNPTVTPSSPHPAAPKNQPAPFSAAIPLVSTGIAILVWRSCRQAGCS
ncbi:MAG: hypothetical protein WC379_12995 [Methanoregula sp.]|jgi:hypothetical protein